MASVRKMLSLLPLDKRVDLLLEDDALMLASGLSHYITSTHDQSELPLLGPSLEESVAVTAFAFAFAFGGAFGAADFFAMAFGASAFGALAFAPPAFLALAAATGFGTAAIFGAAAFGNTVFAALMSRHASFNWSMWSKRPSQASLQSVTVHI